MQYLYDLIEEWLFSLEGAVASFEKAAARLESAVGYHLNKESVARSKITALTETADTHKAQAARAANISCRINDLIS